MTIDELRRIVRLSYYKAAGQARLDEQLELLDLLMRWKRNEDSKLNARPSIKEATKERVK